MTHREYFNYNNTTE